MKITDRLYARMQYGLDRLISSEKTMVCDSTDALVSDEKAKLDFIVWGDPQISCLSPLRSARVYRACRDVEKAEGKFDALVLLGDITETGADCEYRFVQKLLSAISDKFGSIFAVTGNHDIRLRNYRKQMQRFSSFLKGIDNGVVPPEGKPYFSKAVNGYKFIMMGSDKATFEGAYISDKQLSWLDQELKAEQDSGKPVFVFNHQPLKNTNGLPVTFLGKGKWRGSVGNESDKVRAIFSKYSNVIFFTGHLHYCTSEYTYEDCGSFKAISVPTVGVLNHGKFDKHTQGYVISVYDDKLIARSRIFGEGRYTDTCVANCEFEIGL